MNTPIADLLVERVLHLKALRMKVNDVIVDRQTWVCLQTENPYLDVSPWSPTKGWLEPDKRPRIADVPLNVATFMSSRSGESIAIIEYEPLYSQYSAVVKLPIEKIKEHPT